MQQDHPSPGPYGLANTDLPGTLRYGDQHDVHDPYASHQQGNGADTSQHPGQGVIDLIHGIQDITLAVHAVSILMPGQSIQSQFRRDFDRLRHIRIQNGDVKLADRLFSCKPLSRCQRQQDHRISGAAQSRAAFLQQAYHGKRCIVYSHRFSQNIIAFKQIPRHLCTDNAYMGAKGNICLHKKASALYLCAVNIPILCRNTQNASGAAAGPLFYNGIGGKHRRHAFNKRSRQIAFQFLCRNGYLLIGDLRADKPGSQRINAAGYGLSGACANRHKHDHCHHADNDPQHGQKGTHFIKAYAPQGHFYGIQHMHPSCPP